MPLSPDDTIILSAVRSPIGKFRGSLANEPSHVIGSHLVKECISRSTIQNNLIDDVLLGQILTAGQGLNPSRQTALLSGFSNKTPAATINMACASGLKSIAIAFDSLKSGYQNFIIAGGQENMSLAPHSILLRKPYKYGDVTLIDTLLKDALIDPLSGESMGLTAERVAKLYGISKLEQDQFSVRSQELACNSYIDNDVVRPEIVSIPIFPSINCGIKSLFSIDESPRRNVSLESISKLQPYWLSDGSGSVTPGNASSINDGAACVLISKYDCLLKLKSYDKESFSSHPPLAKIISSAQASCDPGIMGIAPVFAVKKALKRAGWTTDDVDLWEINEAFAATTLACASELKIEIAKLNVTGGAIALGHPVGASGCRILVTLIYRLIDKPEARRGVATICAGGGMAIAVCLEKLLNNFDF